MFIYDVVNLNHGYYRNAKNTNSDLSAFCKSENINLEYLLFSLSSLKRK